MSMKLRNRLIALTCLILFLSIGFALFLNTSRQRPFALILFVSDNLSPSVIASARIFSGGGDARLQMEDFPHAALCRNAANDYSVPETASASTEIAAGKRVNRSSLCIDPDGSKLPSLLEEASTKGRSTGLITTGKVTGTTAAAYYAKTLNPENKEDLLQQYIAHPPFDFVAGGGGDVFTNNAHAASNDAGIVAKLTAQHVSIHYSIVDLENQPFWKRVPVLCLLSPENLNLSRFGIGNSEAPTLADLVRVAIKRLESNRNGYLLVVDDPLIASAAASNDAETMFDRMISFDQAIATARRYAGQNALILVTGRENVGGLSLNGYPFLRDKGVSILSLNNQGYPSLCWSTGPGYAVERKTEPDHGQGAKPLVSGILTQPPASTLSSAVGTAGDVLAFGSGAGSERLQGFLNLTDLHRIILDSL